MTLDLLLMREFLRVALSEMVESERLALGDEGEKSSLALCGLCGSSTKIGRGSSASAGGRKSSKDQFLRRERPRRGQPGESESVWGGDRVGR